MIVSSRASKTCAHLLYIITHSLLIIFAWSRDHLSGHASNWVGKIGYCEIGVATNENLAIWEQFPVNVQLCLMKIFFVTR
jgi:hypothetical protein